MSEGDAALLNSYIDEMLTLQLKIANAKDSSKHGGQQSGKGGSSDYIEKAAREGLDFSKPGERVFVNIAGK